MPDAFVCSRCGKRFAVGQSFAISFTVRDEIVPGTALESGTGERRFCAACVEEVKQIFFAACEKRAVILPVRVPEVGDVVYEAIDGYPIVKSVITSHDGLEWSRCATGESSPIPFTAADLGHTIFPSKREAEAEKKRRAREQN